MSPSEIIYIFIFTATFPALWLLSAFLDHVLPDSTTQQIARKHDQKKSPAEDGAESESER